MTEGFGRDTKYNNGSFSLADNVTSIKRHHANIPWHEVEVLLKRIKLKTNSSNKEICLTLGYAGNITDDWRRTNKVPIRAKYALKGLLADLEVATKDEPIEVKVERVLAFSFEDMLNFLMSLNGVKLEDEVKISLIKKLCEEIRK